MDATKRMDEASLKVATLVFETFSKLPRDDAERIANNINSYLDGMNAGIDLILQRHPEVGMKV